MTLYVVGLKCALLLVLDFDLGPGMGGVIGFGNDLPAFLKQPGKR